MFNLILNIELALLINIKLIKINNFKINKFESKQKREFKYNLFIYHSSNIQT